MHSLLLARDILPAKPLIPSSLNVNEVLPRLQSLWHTLVSSLHTQSSCECSWP